jgi:hypothetical protein
VSTGFAHCLELGNASGDGVDLGTTISIHFLHVAAGTCRLLQAIDNECRTGRTAKMLAADCASTQLIFFSDVASCWVTISRC